MVFTRFPVVSIRAAVLTLAALWAAPTGAAQTGAPVAPTVAAAASLKFALQDLAERFRVDTGLTVRLAFGSSGNIFRQIRQGAPFELFFSADETYVFDLHRAGLTADAGAVYAVGRLALFAPQGSPFDLTAGTATERLTAALAAGQVRRFAIANPEHAPYGRAAEQALQSLGLWQTVRPLLVLGENVAQAAQFAASGSTQGGLIAYSLALQPALRKRGSVALLAEQLHRPLRQRLVLLADAGPAARRFSRYALRPQAASLWRRHGFGTPGD